MWSHRKWTQYSGSHLTCHAGLKALKRFLSLRLYPCYRCAILSHEIAICKCNYFHWTVWLVSCKNWQFLHQDQSWYRFLTMIQYYLLCRLQSFYNWNVISPAILSQNFNSTHFSRFQAGTFKFNFFSGSRIFLETIWWWSNKPNELSFKQSWAESRGPVHPVSLRLESRLKLFLFSSIAEFAAIKIKSKSQNLHCCNVYNNIYITYHCELKYWGKYCQISNKKMI